MGEAGGMELIYSLVGYPDETEWIEFKTGNNDPERIGRDISALANAAAYLKRARAYKVWGVEDGTHRLVGTSFDPYHAKGKGNQDLLIWLRTHLSVRASYEFESVVHDGMTFVVLTVEAASSQPICFDRAAYIREGSSTTKLVAGSAKEAKLWERLQSGDFESKVAERDVTLEELEERIDIDAYFRLLEMRRPSHIENAVRFLAEQDIVRFQDNGRFSITNLGALLVGRSLASFAGLRKRVIRVISYCGRDVLDKASDNTFDAGYALSLPAAEQHILTLLPQNERLDGAFRRLEPVYPVRAVRELLCNMVIHQDLADSYSALTVSVFDGRIEFSNPGASLVPTEYMLNASPKSRNVALAGLLRQMHLCEEQGSGWDIVVASCEARHMAAPRVESEEDLGTRVTLYAGDAYSRMKKAERKDAAYWHACLMCARDDAMCNQSLRERFGLDASRKNTVAISRLIKECCDDGIIKDEDEDVGDKYRRYLPFWA